MLWLSKKQRLIPTKYGSVPLCWNSDRSLFQHSGPLSSQLTYYASCSNNSSGTIWSLFMVSVKRPACESIDSCIRNILPFEMLSYTLVFKMTLLMTHVLFTTMWMLKICDCMKQLLIRFPLKLHLLIHVNKSVADVIVVVVVVVVVVVDDDIFCEFYLDSMFVDGVQVSQIPV